MLLESLANELVSVTSALVGGRTINIMNTEGIIIASTETGRIGTFHQGALEAVRTGKTVNIRKDQLPLYPGAKEGCNMPLRVSGSIIGVVGIYGDPSEIQPLAHLLEVYAAKYYQLEAMASPRLAENEMRGRVLGYLLSSSETAVTNAVALMGSHKIQLTFPVAVAVISHLSGAPVSFPQEPLAGALGSYLDPQADVWGVVDDRLVLVMSERAQPLAARLRRSESGEAALLSTYRISFGATCRSMLDIRWAYEQALILDATSPDACNDIQQFSTMCRYMLAHTAVTEAPFLSALYDRLCREFSPEERRTLLKCAECYYDAGRAVNKAAAELFIHKNTLQYRVHRLLDALELDRCGDFQREYLIRLLAELYKRKQGLRAL